MVPGERRAFALIPRQGGASCFCPKPPHSGCCCRRRVEAMNARELAVYKFAILKDVPNLRDLQFKRTVSAVRAVSGRSDGTRWSRRCVRWATGTRLKTKSRIDHEISSELRRGRGATSHAAIDRNRPVSHTKSLTELLEFSILPPVEAHRDGVNLFG